ncbi:MAG: hypothetical protein IK142_00075 [Clostridiales bacterium]|nr:hypothetical protein [Clostridiales bacterium]
MTYMNKELNLSQLDQITGGAVDPEFAYLRFKMQQEAQNRFAALAGGTLDTPPRKPGRLA